MKEPRLLRSIKYFIFRRPRILNFLHRFHLVEPQTQTIVPELSMLAKYASGARLAAEIGTFQGVSAVSLPKAYPQMGICFALTPGRETAARMIHRLRSANDTLPEAASSKR